jgi:hypothetical protein
MVFLEQAEKKNRLKNLQVMMNENNKSVMVIQTMKKMKKMMTKTTKMRSIVFECKVIE